MLKRSKLSNKNAPNIEYEFNDQKPKPKIISKINFHG